eukprot:5034287-Pyramimonas_sp.AAC.1
MALEGQKVPLLEVQCLEPRRDSALEGQNNSILDPRGREGVRRPEALGHPKGGPPGAGTLHGSRA